MAIAPLIIAIRAAGAAALARTSAALRAFGTRIAAAARAAAAAARTTSTYTAALGRLVAALRRVAIAARIAAAVIGGALVRALRAAARAAGNLLGTLAMLAARFALMGAIGITVLVPVIGIVGNLLGGIQLLAPAVVAVAAAFATWKLATKGFGDALNADNAEDLNAALKKLSPTARQAALTLRDLRQEWKSTQQKVQDAFFKDARRDFIMISRTIQKVADVWLPKLAKSFADARMYIAQVIAAAGEAGQLDRIMAGVHQFINGLLDSVPWLLRAFLDIAEVAAPSFGKLGDNISDAAMRFADWIRKLKEDGTLKAWLDKAKVTFQKIMDIGKEIGGIFKDIWKGTDGGDGFLDNLKRSIQEFRDWLKSDNGQEFIQGFLRGAEALANLVVWIGEAADAFAEFRDWLRGIGDNIQGFFAALGAAATAMFTIFTGGGAAFGWIAAAVTRIGGLVTAVQGAATAINTALNSIRTSVIIDIITRRSDSKGWAKPIGGGSGGSAPKFYAHGGRVSAGRPVVVGDGGRPEMFVPDSAGKILPSVPTGGGPTRILVAPGPAAVGNPMVDLVLSLFRSGQLRLTVDRSNRVVPA